MTKPQLMRRGLKTNVPRRKREGEGERERKERQGGCRAPAARKMDGDGDDGGSRTMRYGAGQGDTRRDGTRLTR
jgi:hypothetical protein